MQTDLEMSRRLDAAHRRALTTWSDAAGCRGGCRWTGPDDERLELKRLEGAAVALRDARRCVERGGRTSEDAIQYVLAEWTEMARFRRAPDWAAYTQGGIAALVGFIEGLGG